MQKKRQELAGHTTHNLPSHCGFCCPPTNPSSSARSTSAVEGSLASYPVTLHQLATYTQGASPHIHQQTQRGRGMADDEQQEHSSRREDGGDANKDVAEPSPLAGGGGGSGGSKAQQQQDGTGLLLPLARVKKMMKDTADVKIVSADAAYVVARAAELFLQELTARSHAALQEDKQRKALDYKDVAAVVHSWESVDFLRSVVPKKVKLANVMEKLQAQHDKMQPRCLNED